MNWKKELEHNVTTAEEIAVKMHLSSESEKKLEEILEHFPMSATRYYLSLIDWNAPPEELEKDPIFRMAIPSIAETDLSGTFDTSGEGSNTVLSGLQHKYHETALMLSTNICAMYCRHCFRKRLVGLSQNSEAEGDISEIAEYICRHSEISNVLISGGDAFMNSNERIRELLEAFTAIPSLDLIRFGTRTPVVFPMRIYEDQELLDLLRSFSIHGGTARQGRKQIYVITQFNHPREITEQSRRAVDALMRAGVVVRNQTVLLKGVNDDPAVLGRLLKSLTGIGVLPYYVFQCRPVQGVKAQFQVPLLQGYEIVEKAKAMQNGQGKAFRYCLSHETGKIEILGVDGEEMLFKYHQAKYDKDAGRLFKLPVRDDQCWLD